MKAVKAPRSQFVCQVCGYASPKWLGRCTECGEFGSVIEVSTKHLRIYVENAGEFDVPLAAVTAVHSKKVILDIAKLDPKLKAAIRHAHDREEPGL